MLHRRSIDKYIDGVQYSYWYFGGEAIIEGDDIRHTCLWLSIYLKPEHLIVPRKVTLPFP